ncbi:MAG: zinc-binding dehydrogenase, partial [Spirochaetaceae bacterium]
TEPGVDAHTGGRCNRLPRFRTRGLPNRPVRTRLGHNIDGTLAEFAVVPVEQCVPVPETVSTRDAVFLQASRRALYAVHRSAVSDGDYVAIIGAGDMGIIAAQLVRNLGGTPILVDTGETRLDLARGLGFEHTINPFNAYAAEEIEWTTSGDMADVVIDMTGRSDVASQCPDFAAEGGRIVYTRTQQPDAFVSTRSLVKKELSVLGCQSCGAPPEVVFAEMAAGHIRVDSLVSTQLPFEAAPLVIPSVVENPDSYMKVLFGVG